MANEKHKACWHSEMVSRSPLTVVFTSAPQKSKYDGKPDYARFTDTDGMDRMLNIENAAVRGALESVPLNQPVTVTAEGSRDGATLRWAAADGAAVPQQQAPKPQGAPLTTTQQVRQQYAPQVPAQSPAEMLALSIGAAHEAVTLYRQRYGELATEFDAAHVQAFATTIFIAACRREVSLAARDDDQGAWLDLGAKLEEATVLGCLTDAEKQRVETAIGSQNAEKIAAAMTWIDGKIDAAKKAAEDAQLPFDRAPLVGATA